MISEKEMKNLVGKKVKFKFLNGNLKTVLVTEFVRKETDEEEPMLFYGESGAIEQSFISEYKILN